MYFVDALKTNYSDHQGSYNSESLLVLVTAYICDIWWYIGDIWGYGMIWW